MGNLTWLVKTKFKLHCLNFFKGHDTVFIFHKFIPYKVFTLAPRSRSSLNNKVKYQGCIKKKNGSLRQF